MQHKSTLLSSFPTLKHGFFAGYPVGFSKEAQVLEGLRDFPMPLITLKQMHGTQVWPVRAEVGKLGEGDGLVTCEKNKALGVFTADCGPVLFYDPAAQVIGACHAGWRGARAGIIQETLKVMEKRGASRSQIHAALGPTIQQRHYEVGPEFPEAIGKTYETYFYPSQKKEHHYFNLPLYIKNILLENEVVHIDDLQIDTFSTSFLSRRRAIKEGQGAFQHNLSIIAIT